MADLPLLDQTAHAGIGGVDLGRLSTDAHFLAGSAHSKHKVHFRFCADGEDHAVAHFFLEAGGGSHYLIRPRRHVSNAVTAAAVGNRRTYHSRLQIRGCHRRVRNHSTLLILDGTQERTEHRLGVRLGRIQQPPHDHRENTHQHLPGASIHNLPPPESFLSLGPNPVRTGRAIGSGGTGKGM